MKKTLIFLILGIFCFAHGVSYTVDKKEAFLIRLSYSDGSFMSYASIKIFSPDDYECEFQSGLTDKNGCFLFIPDKKGLWKVIADDEMGHFVAIDINVDDKLNLNNNDIKVSKKFSKWEGVI